LRDQTELELPLNC